MTIFFDGNQQAEQDRNHLREVLKQKAQECGWTRPLTIASIVFGEDPGGRLYTRKKTEAASQVGINYQPYFFSLGDQVTQVKAQIEALNFDPQVTGIIIQKPTRRVYQDFMVDPTKTNWNGRPLLFDEWWQVLTETLIREKDVDGLSPAALAAAERGTWRGEGYVLAATAKAVVRILELARRELHLVDDERKTKVLILGKSDLLGRPLAGELRHQGFMVDVFGRQELQAQLQKPKQLRDYQVVVSAVGKPGLIGGEMLAERVIAIDVGEPVGDFDFNSVATKASFITPVPGGVGPMTVVSLLENCLELALRAEMETTTTGI